MKKTLVVFLSILMVFMLVPVLPNTVYATSHEVGPEAVVEAILNAEGPARGTTNINKVVGERTNRSVGGATLAGATPSVSELDEFAVGSIVDDTLPTAGWVAIDADGDGYNWTYGQDYAFGYPSLAGNDSEAFMSASYENMYGYMHDYEPLEPDNWLVSPAVKVPAGKQLQFFVGGVDSNYFLEHYGVYVSTTSQTDLDSFKLLQEATLSSVSFKGVTVDLSEYAGKTVYIAFRHFDCSDEYWMVLDGVGLSDAGTPATAPETAERPWIGRIKGKTRYDTALEIALRWTKETGYAPSNVILATGDNFADALAGSALSTAMYAPMLLVSPNAPSSIENALLYIETFLDSDSMVVILGGEKAIPASVEDELDYLGIDYARIGGKSRFETNLQVLSIFQQAGMLTEGSDLLVCDGYNWPDAATASATGVPMLLVPKDELTKEQVAFLESIEDSDGNEGGKLYFGIVGGEKAVTKEIAKQLEDYQMEDEDVFRMYGKGRADTAVAVADIFYGGYTQGLSFAYAYNYPDCIAGGFLAWYFSCPILYGDASNPDTFLTADAPFAEQEGSTIAFVFGGKKLIDGNFVATLLEPNLD